MEFHGISIATLTKWQNMKTKEVKIPLAYREEHFKGLKKIKTTQAGDAGSTIQADQHPSYKKLKTQQTDTYGDPVVWQVCHCGARLDTPKWWPSFWGQAQCTERKTDPSTKKKYQCSFWITQGKKGAFCHSCRRSYCGDCIQK